MRKSAEPRILAAAIAREGAFSVMGRAALTWAARGVPVFPCNPKTKQPLTETGLHMASAWGDQVALWWLCNPQAMIGVPTGKRSGFWVVDLDRADDPTKCGETQWTGVERTHGPVETWSTRTGSGGRHMWFQFRAGKACEDPVEQRLDLRNSQSKIRPGIDVRAEGGYVIVPPSVRSDGGRYRAETAFDRDAIAVAPDWLLELAAPRQAAASVEPAPLSARAAAPGPRRSGGDRGGWRGDRPVDPQRRLEAAETKVRTAGKGTRNATLNCQAYALGGLVAHGLLSEAAVVDALSRGAQFNGYLGEEGPEHVRTVIRSGLTAAREKGIKP